MAAGETPAAPGPEAEAEAELIDLARWRAERDQAERERRAAEARRALVALGVLHPDGGGRGGGGGGAA